MCRKKVKGEDRITVLYLCPPPSSSSPGSSSSTSNLCIYYMLDNELSIIEQIRCLEKQHALIINMVFFLPPRPALPHCMKNRPRDFDHRSVIKTIKPVLNDLSSSKFHKLSSKMISKQYDQTCKTIMNDKPKQGAQLKCLRALYLSFSLTIFTATSISSITDSYL